MKKDKKSNTNKKLLLLRALKQRALVYSLTGHHKEGIEDLRLATRFCSRNPDIDVATTAMQRINLADFIARNTGAYFEAEKLIKRTFSRIDTRKHLQVYARGLFYLGVISYLQGNYDRALFYNKKALGIYESRLPERKRSIMETYVSMGLLHHYMRDLRTSLSYYRKAHGLAKAIDDKVAISTISNNMGTVYRDLGDFERAHAHFSAHLSLSEKLGYKKGIGIAMGNIANIYLDRELAVAARELLLKAQHIFEEIGYLVGRVLSLGNRALAAYRLGELSEARNLYEQCVQLSAKIGFTIGTVIGHMGLGRIAKDTDNLSSAELHLEKAKGLSVKIGDDLTLAEVYHHLSTLKLKAGDTREARRHAEQSLILARRSGGKREEIMAWRSLGMACSGSDVQKANRCFRKSLMLAKKHRRKLEKAKSCFALSNFLISLGKKTEALDHLSQALAIFKEIRSRVWLKKAQQAKKRLR